MIDTTKLRARLEEEKAKLEGELQTHGSLDPKTKDWQGTTDMSTSEGADRDVVADEMEDLATNTAVVEKLEARYRDVVDALAKIDNGTYGICEKSGEVIPTERLEANPAARTCVEHA